MDRWAGKVALVTGASAGIGADIAARLVKHGMIVYGCARGVDRIEQAAQALASTGSGSPPAVSGKLIPVRCDLTKEEDILRMFEKIQAERGALHVCINNAGMSRKASVLAGSRRDWQEVFDVNVFAVRQCTQEAVRLMRCGGGRGDGVRHCHIITINSMSGHRPTSKVEQSAYQTAKTAVTLITELTRREVCALDDASCRIRVGQVSPGMVETEFEARYQGDASVAAATYASLDTVLHACDITDAVEYMLSAPESVQVHDVLMRPTTQAF